MSKAPGKAYREGISLIELFKMFPDDAAAERWLEEQRWGAAGSPDHCPLCGSTEKLRLVPSGRPLPYWCGSCRRNFSVKTGTVMHRSKIGLQKWAIATYLWAVSLKGVSSMQLHRDLDITQKSAYFMAQRLREAWSELPPSMSGPVEVDESFFGGREKNKHERKKARAGRGSVGKTIVAGAKDRASGYISAEVVERTDAETLQGFVENRAAEGATVYTDEAHAYKGRPCEHETVCHSVSEYVNEFATSHNLRSKDTKVMMAETVARMIGKRLTYADLIAD